MLALVALALAHDAAVPHAHATDPATALVIGALVAAGAGYLWIFARPRGAFSR